MVFVTVDFACVVVAERPGLAKKQKEKLQSRLAGTGLLCKPGLKAWITKEFLTFQGLGSSVLSSLQAKALS